MSFYTVFWLKPGGLTRPKPGTTVRVELQQIIGRRPLHAVGNATVYGRDGTTCVRINEAHEEGRTAAALLREDMIDAVWWGSRPKLRLK